MLNNIYDFINQHTGLEYTTQLNLISSFLIVFFAWLFQYIIIVTILTKIKDARTLYKWQKIVSYITYTIAFILVIRVWFAGMKDIATFLGIFTAGLAIAMKEPLTNLAGWGYIIFKKLFVVGDRIQIGPHIGDVIDQQLSTFMIMELGNWVQGDQSTGRVIQVPNGKVFTDVLANYTRGLQYLWDEITLTVTFESNWKKAHKILDEIACKHTCHLSESVEEDLKRTIEKLMVYYSSLTPRVYVSIQDSGVALSVRYICRTRDRRETSEKIMIDILDAFAVESDIDFAYPTQRLYYNPIEGKPDIRASHPQ